MNRQRVMQVLMIMAMVSLSFIGNSAQADLNDGLVAHYQFEDNVLDASSYNNDGAVYTNPVYVEGVIGKAIKLDSYKADFDYIYLGNQTRFDADFVNGNISIATWIKGDSFAVLSDFTCSGNYTLKYMDGILSFSFSLSDWVNNVIIQTNSPIDNQTFHHIAVTTEGDTFKLFVDGVKVKEETHADDRLSWCGTASVTSGVMINGRSVINNSNPPSPHWKPSNETVYLDEYRVYNRSLSEAEIQSLYAAGSNSSGSIQHIVLTPSSPNAVIEQGKNAVVFGTKEPNSITIKKGALVKIINNPGTNTITIEADSTEFKVSRSGAMVTFETEDASDPSKPIKTVIKLPATKTNQIIKFNNGSLNLSIDSGKVKLGEQEITKLLSSITATPENPENDEQIAIFPTDGIVINTVPIMFKWRAIKGVGASYRFNLYKLHSDVKYEVYYSSSEAICDEEYCTQLFFNNFIDIGDYKYTISIHNEDDDVYHIVDEDSFSIPSYCSISFSQDADRYSYEQRCISSDNIVTYEIWSFNRDSSPRYTYRINVFEDPDEPDYDVAAAVWYDSHKHKYYKEIKNYASSSYDDPLTYLNITSTKPYDYIKKQWPADIKFEGKYISNGEPTYLSWYEYHEIEYKINYWIKYSLGRYEISPKSYLCGQKSEFHMNTDYYNSNEDEFITKEAFFGIPCGQNDSWSDFFGSYEELLAKFPITEGEGFTKPPFVYPGDISDWWTHHNIELGRTVTPDDWNKEVTQE